MIFHLTSPNFEGYVLFEYCDESDLLTTFSVANAQLTNQQQNWLVEHIPQHVKYAQIEDWGKGKLTVIPAAPPTFNEFWTAYAKGNTQFCGAKSKAETAWAQLNIADKVSAIKFIPKYLRHKADTNQNVAYAVTFLNQKSWQ